MRISKKILAGVLAALMAVAMMPFTAFAATVSVSTGAELKTAVANAVDGDVIEFTADNTTYPATSGALVIPVDGKDITIDLKGHTQYFRVSGETAVSYPTDLFVLKNDAKLTVKDTVGGGAIYTTYSANSAAYTFNVLDSSDLVIDGGTYVVDQANYGGVIVYQNSADASTTINDGTFTANTGAKARRDYLINNTRGDVVINGGTFSTPRAFDYVVNAGNTADTNVSINDGEFNGTLSGTKGKLVINGGTFKKYDTVTANDVSKYYADGVAQLEDGTVAALPTATVTDIAGTEYDIAKQFAANNDGTVFNDYYADFIVTVDKTVYTDDVQLFGKIANGEWVQFPEMRAEAGTAYYLARDAFQWQPTYEDICTTVGTFSCAVKGEAFEATTMTVQLVIYKDGVAPIVINEFTYNIPEKDTQDTMSIIVDNNIDLNINMDTTDDKVETIEYTFTNPYNDDTEDTQTVAKSANDDVTSFTVALSPAQVNDEIKAVAKDENGDVIREVKTSIADYCKTIISNVEANPTAYGAKSEELAGLAQSTLDYGKAASDYFNYNEAAFTEDYSDDYKNFDPSSITYEGSNTRNFPSGITLTGVTYVATSVPELRFYIDTTLSDSELEAMNDSLTSNIGTAKFVKCDDKRMLQITNINIVDFGKQLNVELGSDTILTFVPISWAKSAATKDGAMGDLGKSICYYYAKSVAYFG